MKYLLHWINLMHDSRNSMPPVSPPWSEIFMIVALCFGLFILGSILAVDPELQLEGFTDNDLAFTVGFEIAVGVSALLILQRRGYVLADLLPKPSWVGSLWGVGVYVLAMVASLFAIEVFAADLPEQPIEKMMETASVTMPMVVLMAVVNGLYEELFLLGYLQRFLMGHGVWFAVGFSLLIRLLYHLYQGPMGAVSILALGAIFGFVYLRTGNLWSVVVAHMLADIVPFL